MLHLYNLLHEANMLLWLWQLPPCKDISMHGPKFHFFMNHKFYAKQVNCHRRCIWEMCHSFSKYLPRKQSIGRIVKLDLMVEQKSLAYIYENI